MEGGSLHCRVKLDAGCEDVYIISSGWVLEGCQRVLDSSRQLLQPYSSSSLPYLRSEPDTWLASHTFRISALFVSPGGWQRKACKQLINWNSPIHQMLIADTNKLTKTSIRAGEKKISAAQSIGNLLEDVAMSAQSDPILNIVHCTDSAAPQAPHRGY